MNNNKNIMKDFMPIHLKAYMKWTNTLKNNLIKHNEEEIKI